MSDLETLVARVLAELRSSDAAGAGSAVGTTPTARPQQAATASGSDLDIDVPDPTGEAGRLRIGVANPVDADALGNLRRTTSARLAVGRAGPRPRTGSLLLFQADHAVTQDAIYGVVREETKAAHDLFSVTSQAEDRQTYLLRPDLGRRLSDAAKAEIDKRCKKGVDVQIVVGDGLSAAAIDNNLADILPVITQGLSSAGFSIGTPFFVTNCRVGVMNDINAIVRAKVLLLLIGERPGLGIADAMSAYMGYDPQPGKTDADRDLVCMITRGGGTNPLEAGAYIVEVIKRMMKHQASGVRLREIVGEE